MRSANALILAALAVFTAVVATVATEPIGASPAAGAVPGVLAFALMLAASTLLLHQFLQRGGARLLVLAITMLSCAALAARGAAVDGAWPWLAWHVLLPAGIAAALWGGPERMRANLSAPGARRATVLGVAAALVVAGALLSVAALLPNRDDASALGTGVGVGAGAASALALAFVLRRARRAGIERRLVACCAAALSAIVLGLVAGDRGTAGWWAARAAGDLAVFALAAALWIEYRRLYRKLALAGPPVAHLLSRDEVVARGVRLLPGLSADNAPLTIAVVEVEEYDLLLARHGQAAGERVLSEVGQRIASALREHDAVGQLGEASFLLLLPDAALDGGRVALERVVGNIRRRPISSLRSDVPVRVGVGVAQAEPGRTDLDAAIERAYRAAGTSRERAVSHAGDHGPPRRPSSAPPPAAGRRPPPG